MAKVKKHYFSISTRSHITHGADDRHISEDIDINVTAKGQFFLKIPDHLIDEVINLDIKLNSHPTKKEFDPKYVVDINLDNLIKRTEDIFRKLVTFEVLNEEIKIRYSFGGACNYTTDENGENIEFDGNRKNMSNRNDYFWVNMGTQDRILFSVGIGVEVYKLYTIKFSNDQIKNVYSRITSIDKDTNPNLHELLRVRGIKCDYNYTEVDYTEQIAKALSTGILSIINIYHELKRFNHKETFLDYVEKSSNLLGDGSNT